MFPKPSYTLRQVTPHGFLVECPEAYDLAMLFARCEEYYESPYPEINGKPFQFVELMHRYVHDTTDQKPMYNRHGEKVGKLFVYPWLWTGFNLPGKVIEECLATVPDWNFYDETMKDIVTKIRQKTNTFYLIGVKSGDNETFEHELAHVLFATNPIYRRTMERMVNRLPVRDLIFRVLRKEKYGEDHMVDETQAYLATPSERNHRPSQPSGVLPSGLENYCKPFRKVFRQWTKNAPVLLKQFVV